MSEQEMRARGLMTPTARGLVAGVAVLALVPYTALKVLWLAGARIGMVPGTHHMQDPRMTIGNAITILLAVLGVVIALALAQRWGERLPWWLVVLPAAAATGVLAPIALGLPIGVLLQAAVTGGVASGGEGDLLPWVFALVYSGFGVYGVALAVLFADHALRRWRPLLTTPPRTPRDPGARALPAAAIVIFAAAMLWWAFAPPGTGLAGWESLAQRTVLAVVAALGLAGCAALLTTPAVPPLVRWAIAWIGCCTVAVQGPAQLLLARDATIDPRLLAVTLLATPAAAWLGLSALRRGAVSVERVG